MWPRRSKRAGKSANVLRKAGAAAFLQRFALGRHFVLLS
jgi:hypothetical protein